MNIKIFRGAYGGARSAAATLLAVVVLSSGCLKPGLRGVSPYRAEMGEAGRDLRSITLPPSRNLSSDEWQPTLDRVSSKFKAAAWQTCHDVGARNCEKVMMPVSLVDDPTINAFVDANHNVYFHTGLITHAASDEEIGAVLAHEYGHVFAGHIDKSETNAAIGLLAGLAAGTAVASASGTTDAQTATDIITGGMAAGSQFGSLSFSPQYELEADYYAALILANSGTDLDHGKDLLVRLARSGPSNVGDAPGMWGIRARVMAATHPADDQRIARWLGINRSIEASKRLMQQQPSYNHNDMLRKDALNRLLESPLVVSNMTRWVNHKNGQSGMFTINKTTYKRKCELNCVRISEVEYSQGDRISAEYWLCDTGSEWIYREARGLTGRLVGGCKPEGERKWWQPVPQDGDQRSRVISIL